MGSSLWSWTTYIVKKWESKLRPGTFWALEYFLTPYIILLFYIKIVSSVLIVRFSWVRKSTIRGYVIVRTPYCPTIRASVTFIFDSSKNIRICREVLNKCYKDVTYDRQHFLKQTLWFYSLFQVYRAIEIYLHLTNATWFLLIIFDDCKSMLLFTVFNLS